MLPSNGHLSRATGARSTALVQPPLVDADHGAFASALAAHTITWRGHVVQGAIAVTPRGIECLGHNPGPGWQASYSFGRAGVGIKIGLWLNLRYQIPAPGTATLRYTLLGSAPLSSVTNTRPPESDKHHVAKSAAPSPASPAPRRSAHLVRDDDSMFYLAMVAGGATPPLRPPIADADACTAAVAPAMAVRGERRCQSGEACRRPGEAVCGGRHCLPHAALANGR
jgi:hypothetical protein